MRLPELQDKDKEAKTLRAAGLPKDWENVEEMLWYRELAYVSEIICSKVISHHHDNPLAGHFDIDKTRELVSRKYY